jgi:DNA-binding NarL/FixJ family response regulator
MFMDTPGAVTRATAFAETGIKVSNGFKRRPTRHSQASVLCIDDDEDSACSLASALAKLGYAVELAPDGEAGLAKILANRPDLVLYDFSTLRMGGLEACLELLQQLSEAGPRYAALPFVLMTGQRDREGESNDRGLEANDSVAESIDLDLLGAVVETRLRRVESQAGAAREKQLTAREKDVLTWAARGKTSAEIAIILGIAKRTINFHCDNAMKRLDVINRTQAVAKAVAEGLIGV